MGDLGPFLTRCEWFAGASRTHSVRSCIELERGEQRQPVVPKSTAECGAKACTKGKTSRVGERE